MDDATARALNAINRSFYRDHAEPFSASREQPWPGWERLAQHVEGLATPLDGLDLLDVGCGNGRLGRFLAARVPALRYLGVDASAPLLSRAKALLSQGPGCESVELLEHDFVEVDLAAALGGRRFGFVALFGVLHHVPGRARRRALLDCLVEHLAPQGLLAVTSWRLRQFERFRARVRPASAWPEHGIDPEKLEPGDHLLPFGEAGGVRYVHFADEDETPALLAELPCEALDSYVADGELNRYTILRGRIRWRGDAGASRARRQSASR